MTFFQPRIQSWVTHYIICHVSVVSSDMEQFLVFLCLCDPDTSRVLVIYFGDYSSVWLSFSHERIQIVLLGQDLIDVIMYSRLIDMRCQLWSLGWGDVTARFFHHEVTVSFLCNYLISILWRNSSNCSHVLFLTLFSLDSFYDGWRIWP